jgi:methyl-accepting chemotaxis protein
MTKLQNISDSKFIYCLLPALPVMLAGLIFNWQEGATLYVVLTSLLLMICGTGTGLFLWQRHQYDLAQLNARWLQDESNNINAVATYTSELERLLLTISPMLSQHVMVSREHTEQEIIALTSRFAGMVNELQQIVDSTDNTLDGQHFHLDSVLNNSHDLLQPVLKLLKQVQQSDHTVVDDSMLIQAETNIKLTLSNLGQTLTHYRDHVVALRNNAEQIRNDINNVLVSLQFQDRVSQILTQVENNLLNLQKTIQTIQQQGNNRDRDMLQVDASLEHIVENYKSVISRSEREPDGSDDLTFF